MIIFQKAHNKARYFIYTHKHFYAFIYTRKAFILTISDTECCVLFGYGKLNANFL